MASVATLSKSDEDGILGRGIENINRAFKERE